MPWRGGVVSEDGRPRGMDDLRCQRLYQAPCGRGGEATGPVPRAGRPACRPNRGLAEDLGLPARVFGLGHPRAALADMAVVSTRRHRCAEACPTVQGTPPAARATVATPTRNFDFISTSIIRRLRALRPLRPRHQGRTN